MAPDLKAILRERGLTQRAVAEALSVSDPTVSLWASALREGQYRRVPAEHARALADLLQIEPSILRPDLWRAA